MSDYEYPPLRQRVQSLIEQIKSTLLLPIRVATSKLAIRTYLTSLLFFLTSFFLLAIAVAAYTAFYWSYIPRIGFTRQIHLQYDHSHSTTRALTDPLLPHPWGTVTLSPDFASQQLYDITVHLTLPRTPENAAQGNFMLDATLLGPSPIPGSGSGLGVGSPSSALPSLTHLLTGTDAPPVLARSRRTAFLTYYSREIDLARKALLLPAYLTGISQETEALSVQLFEGVSFPRGWRNVPSVFRLEVQSQQRVQIYECSVSFRARFRGLRWVMYNHRIFSATVFVFAFWVTEVGAMGVMWLVLSLVIFPKVDHTAVKSEKSGKRIKQEEGDEEAEEGTEEGELAKLSDTERTFPSYASQPLLRYQSQGVKQEDGEGGVRVGVDGKRIKQEEREGEVEGTEPFPPLALQTGPEAADDEDEEDDYVLDSGLGTSLESSAGGRRESGVRRRKSGRGRAGS